MRRRLLQVLARCRRLFRRTSASVAVEAERAQPDDGRRGAQARFWRELREGQREAEATKRAIADRDAARNLLVTK